MAISRAQGEALPMGTPAGAEDQPRRKDRPRPLERLGEWRRNLAAEISLIDWRSIAAPTAFALLAIGLLIYDRVQERIEGPLYWLTLVLIVTIFMWMVDTNRRRAMMIAWHAEGALQDNVTDLGNRSKLWNDMAVGLSMPRERRVLALLELDGLEEHREREGYASGDALLSRVATRLAETVRGMNGAAYRIEGSRFAVLVSSAEQEPAEIMVVAAAALAEHDDGLVEVSYGGVALPDEANAPETAFEVASQRLQARKQRQRRSASRQAHAVLLAVLSARRPELRDHVRDVSFRVLAVGRKLGIDEDDLDDVVRAAQLQGVGLLAVPEGVLESERRLSDEERRMINQHTEAGERIIAEAPGLEAVARLVRSSGERYDGAGYPDGLRGEEIPLGSRIITACVAFAAMTAARPYRQPGYTTARALDELRADSGTHFDPAVVETLADDIEADR